MAVAFALEALLSGDEAPASLFRLHLELDALRFAVVAVDLLTTLLRRSLRPRCPAYCSCPGISTARLPACLSRGRSSLLGRSESSRGACAAAPSVWTQLRPPLSLERLFEVCLELSGDGKVLLAIVPV